MPLALSRPLATGAHATLNVQLPGPTGEASPVRLGIEVRSCRASADEWRVGAEIVDCSEEDRRRVIAYCNVVWPYLRLRGEDGSLEQVEPTRDGETVRMPETLTALSSTS